MQHPLCIHNPNSHAAENGFWVYTHKETEAQRSQSRGLGPLRKVEAESCLTSSPSSFHYTRGVTFICLQRCTDWVLSALTHIHSFNFFCELGGYYHLHFTDGKTEAQRDESNITSVTSTTSSHRVLRVHHVPARVRLVPYFTQSTHQHREMGTLMVFFYR